MGQSEYISRISIGDYVAFGKQIKKWCETPEGERPKTIGDAKKALDEAGAKVSFPADRFKDGDPVTFIQSPLNGEWVVRLPPVEMVSESVKRIRDGNGYPSEHLPKYYYDYLTTGQEYDEDFLYSRIADYTIAQCA